MSVTGKRGGALHAAAIFALAAGCSLMAQTTSEDPCRYLTADEMGKVFGRPMKSVRRTDVCEYQSTGSALVVVKVSAGPEGTILRHVRSASAQGQKGAEKVQTAAGEAYFDNIIPVFIGRVGSHEVQLEATIQPVPRDAMIAAGTRIMEKLPRR